MAAKHGRDGDKWRVKTAAMGTKGTRAGVAGKDGRDGDKRGRGIGRITINTIWHQLGNPSNWCQIL